MLQALFGIGAAIWAFIGRKAAVGIASVAAVVMMTVAFLICIKSIITNVAAIATVPLWLESVIWWFVPSNWVALCSSILAAKTCRVAFEMAREKIKMLNEAS